MDFKLTEEQEMMKKTVKDLAAREIAPISAELDKDGEFPRDTIKKIADVGLFGVMVPPPFGGTGPNKLNFVLAAEEIAAASASVALSFTISVGSSFLILAFGNDQQKGKYLPPLAKGEKLGSVAVTEPSGGHNWMLTLQTAAGTDGDSYVVNGTKSFTSLAGEAEIYIVFARTDPAKGPMGISTLILEKGTPGFSFGKREDKFGLRAHINGELIFEDCRVPKESLLGPEGFAPLIGGALSATACPVCAAISVGIAQAALDAVVKHVKERTVVAPNTLANFDRVQADIADMTAMVEAARGLAYRAALSEAPPPDPLPMMSETFAIKVALEVTSKALELHGGYGCTKDLPLERYFRDARVISLRSTPDFMRLIAGKIILGISPIPTS